MAIRLDSCDQIGTTTNYLDTGAATNAPARYYRVRLVP